ncbi:hypothetical protein SMSP2_02701 [Limihaloglobus sulfuriphilus]|uniref:Lipoprotein n=1 Tax=Limihaloglobus sulfuriphilus TaxID=1851148 RepID=A0A1Q2MIH0_9BACT|nr:hypothetical protein [Limihaloglobus sulfuriphilus]AQQ72318.1 hypothetical protein SMSP2_02701 [Limihaloglobus sulfuriphilus]
MSKVTLMSAIAIFTISLFLSGCGWDGTDKTSAEISRSQRRTLKTDMKQLNDDINGPLLHIDQPSRLSDRYVR